MNRSRSGAGFTLIEVVISLAASMITIAGLLLGSIGLQKAMNEIETYSSMYSAERRLVDYVSRDLRRALAINVVDESGTSATAAGQTITLSDQQTLTFSLPGYYGSDDPANAAFDQPLGVTTADDRLAYGSGGGAAPSSTVAFRKYFVAAEGCVCFVREEAGMRQVVARNAESLNLRATISSDLHSCLIVGWFRTSASNQLVASYDRVMLRNGSDDF